MPLSADTGTVIGVPSGVLVLWNSARYGTADARAELRQAVPGS